MSAVVKGAQGVLTGVGVTVIKFPLWWYSRGLLHAFSWLTQSIAGYSRTVALGVWARNIFVPMFGRYDWQSRLISVFMRVVNIVGRGLAVLIWTVIACLVFIAYLVVPLIAAYSLVANLVGLLFV